MGIFDKAKDLVNDNKDKLVEHSDQVKEGIDKAGDAFDEKTGDKFSGQVDQAQDLAKDKLDGLGGEQK